MKLIERSIVCRENEGYKDSLRTKPFNITMVIFNYLSDQNDRLFLNKVFEKGNELTEKVNPMAANNSKSSRSRLRIKNNASAGLLAEFCWKKYINMKAGKVIVDYTKFEKASTQIDLITLKTKKLIEVRSSFPRNGLEFAICSKNYQFDILGPYSNSVKPNELKKDFYLRTLFHVPVDKQFHEIAAQDEFKVYLTGGATWEMMNDDHFSFEKDLIAEDYVASEQHVKSRYKVVPFSKALDNQEIFELLIKNN